MALKNIKSNPSNQHAVAKPALSIEHLLKQVDEINCQYHDFNKLRLSFHETGQFIQVNNLNEDGMYSPLADWMDWEQTGTYLRNYQGMFCLDPNRLDQFFDLSTATTIVLINRLCPTRKRPKGVANAFIYMRQAYQGLIPKRKPIFVTRSVEEKGFFDIVDGNSTYFVAKQIGMKSIPAQLI